MTQPSRVRAKTVRLRSNAPTLKQLNSQEWNEGNCRNLVVLPEAGIARCRIGDRVLCAAFDWYEADAESQCAWEDGGEFKCEVCEDCFATSQALASHRSARHPQSAATLQSKPRGKQ